MKLKKILSLFLFTLTVSNLSAQALEKSLSDQINNFIAETNHSRPETQWYQYPTTCLGNGCRTLGGWIRPGNNNEFVSLALENGKDQVINYMGDDNLQGQVVKKILTNESTFSSLRNGTGNALRSFGGYLAGETPTLERLLRDFFKTKESEKLSTQDMLKISACALFQSKLNSLDLINLNFNNFVRTINNSSTFVHVMDQNVINKCFIQGFIRFIVMKNKQKYLPTFDENLNVNIPSSLKELAAIHQILESIGINPLDLDLAKAITIDKLVSDPSQLKQMTLEQIEKTLRDAKTLAVNKFIAGIFSSEYAKVNAEKNLFSEDDAEVEEKNKVNEASQDRQDQISLDSNDNKS